MIRRFGISFFILFFLLPVQAFAVKADNTFISADRLWAIYKKPSVAVMDIRPQSLFARRHVSGSVNIPAFALVKKKVFYNKNVVLVDHGFAACRLLSLRKRMLASGFKHVRILSGGIDAWESDADITPQGVKPFLLRAARKCTHLSPLVIDVRPYKAFSRRHIRGSVSVPFVRDKKKFLARLRRIKPFFNGAGKKFDTPIVFVAGAEAESVVAAALVKKKKHPFSYYLLGGITAWYLEKDYPEARVVVGPGTNGCASCPDAP